MAQKQKQYLKTIIILVLQSYTLEMHCLTSDVRELEIVMQKEGPPLDCFLPGRNSPAVILQPLCNVSFCVQI